MCLFITTRAFMRGKFWAHKTSLTVPFLIEVSVSNQESELSCIYVLYIYIYLYSHTAKYNGTEKNNNIIIT